MSYNSIGRYSANQLYTIGEVGNTSSWVVSFRKRTEFNLISNKYFPASDVNYSNFKIKEETLSPAGLFDVTFIVFAETTPQRVNLTAYDTDDKKIRRAMINWVENTEWTNGLSRPLSQLKQDAAILDIWHFTKDSKNYTKDSLYILPVGDLDFKGDQSFSVDSIPLDFLVIGRE